MENEAPFAKPLEPNVISSGFARELHFVIQCPTLVLIAMVWVIIGKVAASFQALPGHMQRGHEGKHRSSKFSRCGSETILE